MKAQKAQLLAQIQIGVEDDDFKEIMLGVITNQVGEGKWLETPQQCGVHCLDDLPMFKKTKILKVFQRLFQWLAYLK